MIYDVFRLWQAVNAHDGC